MTRGRRLLHRLTDRRFRRRLRLSIIIGLSLEAALLQFHETPWLRAKQDLAIDWMMQMYSGTAPGGGRGLPFTIVDIDERTYRAWEEPPVIPRDRLTALVRFAVERSPALVVVDIDLSRRSGPGDVVLEQYLAELGAKVPAVSSSGREASGSAGPPILLARTFREALPPKQGHEPRSSFLEEVTRAIPNIHWAAPLFELSEDLEIRRWRLIETVCANDQTETILSFQLFAVGLAMSPPAIDDLTRIRRTQPDPCAKADAERRSSAIRMVRVGTREIHVDDDRAKRIIYTIPWKLADPTHVRPMIVLADGRRVPFILHLSAGEVLSRASALGPDVVAGRVVVIGGSFADARDIHRTPIGPMPGIFIIVNAINSLWQFDEFRPVPWWTTLLVTVVLIFFMCFAFAWFSSFRAAVVCTLAIILTIVPASLLLFQSGVWLDFALPLMAVELHQMYEDLQERRHSLRSHRK